MIGRDRLDLAMVAYSEAGTTSVAAQMAGVDPEDLAAWSHDATSDSALDEFEHAWTAHSIRAGLLATGVLIGISVGRSR
jgi:hypothetical protein